MVQTGACRTAAGAEQGLENKVCPVMENRKGKQGEVEERKTIYSNTFLAFSVPVRGQGIGHRDVVLGVRMQA